MKYTLVAVSWVITLTCVICCLIFNHNNLTEYNQVADALYKLGREYTELKNGNNAKDREADHLLNRIGELEKAVKIQRQLLVDEINNNPDRGNLL